MLAKPRGTKGGKFHVPLMVKPLALVPQSSTISRVALYTSSHVVAVGFVALLGGRVFGSGGGGGMGEVEFWVRVSSSDPERGGFRCQL